MQQQKNGVYVVSYGAATSLGESAAATAAAVRAGIMGFKEHPFAIDENADPCIVAMAPYLPPDAALQDRLASLAELAVRETLEQLKLPWKETVKPVLCLGLPSNKPGLPADLETLIPNLLSRFTTFSSTKVYSSGHAAGLLALREAYDQLSRQDHSLCLVGGVDSYFATETLHWIEENEQLHKSDNAWGFVPGEAAGFCLLASGDFCERQQIKPLAQVLHVASAQEPNRIKTETVCTGQGLTQAFRQALRALPNNNKVDFSICDMNGEAYRADEFGFTLARTTRSFVDATSFLSPADCWGDVGAASGPLYVMLAATAAKKKYAIGPHTLVWASSETGERLAALLATDFTPQG